MNESQSNKFGLNYDFVLGWSLPRYYKVFENYRKCLILSGQKILKIAKKSSIQFTVKQCYQTGSKFKWDILGDF